MLDKSCFEHAMSKLAQKAHRNTKGTGKLRPKAEFKSNVLVELLRRGGVPPLGSIGNCCCDGVPPLATKTSTVAAASMVPFMFKNEAMSGDIQSLRWAMWIDQSS